MPWVQQDHDGCVNPHGQLGSRAGCHRPQTGKQIKALETSTVSQQSAPCEALATTILKQYKRLNNTQAYRARQTMPLKTSS